MTDVVCGHCGNVMPSERIVYEEDRCPCGRRAVTYFDGAGALTHRVGCEWHEGDADCACLRILDGDYDALIEVLVGDVLDAAQEQREKLTALQHSWMRLRWEIDPEGAAEYMAARAQDALWGMVIGMHLGLMEDVPDEARKVISGPDFQQWFAAAFQEPE